MRIFIELQYIENSHSVIYSGMFHMLAVNQVEISPFMTRDKLVEFCQSKGIALQAYCCLTRGRKFGEPKLVKMAAR